MDDTAGLNAILDLQSGKITNLGYVSGGVSLRRTACADRAMVFGSKGSWIITDDSAGVAVTSIHLNTPLYPMLVRRNIFVYIDVNGTHAVRADGTLIWEHTGNEITDVAIIGSWIVGHNLSNQTVIVDPTTGKEATGLSSELTSTLKAALNDKGIDYSDLDKAAAWDAATGSILGLNTSTDILTRIPTKELCPG